MRTAKSKPKPKSTKRRAASTDVCCPAPSKDESVELRIERLTNGYLVTKSTYKNGEFKSEKTYSAKKPKLEASADGN